MDRFALESRPGAGVQVVLGKRLPRGSRSVTPARLASIGKPLAATGAADPLRIHGCGGGRTTPCRARRARRR